MPVITPAYPSMCATHNVTTSTQRILTEEFELAAKTSRRIFENTANWSGMVESKIRQLVIKLEAIDTIILAHPYVNSFERITTVDTDEKVDDIFCGKFPEFSQTQTENTTTIHSTIFYIGLEIEVKKDNNGKRTLDIGRPCVEFKNMLMAWEGRVSGNMINIECLKK
ncbi:polynucleotide adenylyltransferase [Nowakowskiella sp. JEL0078]|nr:polynucleotide adenylyltransferase [Nowakowskiella sp. JEL0078]